MGNGSSSAPLAGVKVIDLSRLLPGPACTLHLADLGADVIKVEDTGAGDYAPDAMRAVLHRNKRAIRLDLKQPEGVEALRLLLRDADVLLESFRPGVMDRLGLGYEAVAALNPRIVYCSLTGYGQDGPLAQMAGHDINYCGYSGAASQVGVAPDALALSNLPLADLMGGALGASMGILAALVDAGRTGRGRHVDVAMADGVLAHMIMPLATRSRLGHAEPAGRDTLSGRLPCYAYYRTADGHTLAVGALERKFWDAFCQAIGRADLQPHHRTADEALSARVREQLATLIGSQPLAHWTALLDGVDCCVTPVLSLDDALQHEHFQARGMVVQATHPTYGDVTHLGSPVRMSGHRFGIRRHAPLPGEHSDEVLREAGLDDTRIASLRERKVVA